MNCLFQIIYVYALLMDHVYLNSKKVCRFLFYIQIKIVEQHDDIILLKCTKLLLAKKLNESQTKRPFRYGQYIC